MVAAKSSTPSGSAGGWRSSSGATRSTCVIVGTVARNCSALLQMPDSASSPQAISTLAREAFRSDASLSSVSSGLGGCTMPAASPPQSARWYSRQPGSITATASVGPMPSVCSALAVWWMRASNWLYDQRTGSSAGSAVRRKPSAVLSPKVCAELRKIS